MKYVNGREESESGSGSESESEDESDNLERPTSWHSEPESENALNCDSFALTLTIVTHLY